MNTGVQTAKEETTAPLSADNTITNIKKKIPESTVLPRFGWDRMYLFHIVMTSYNLFI